MRCDPQKSPPAATLIPATPVSTATPTPPTAALHASPGPWFWEDYGFLVRPGHAAVSSLLRDRRFGRQILHLTSREALGWPERPAHLAGSTRWSATRCWSWSRRPGHTRLRARVNRAFVSRRVERLAPAIADMAETLIDALKPGADLIDAFATPIALGIIAALIGAPARDGARLLDWSHRMVAMYRLAPTRADEEAAALAARDFAAYVRRLAAERGREPRDDLVSRLAEGEAAELGEDELVSTVVLLLNAGHEATVHAIGNAAKTLLEAGARFDGSEEAAVEELLRFDPPLHMFTRYVLQDLEIDGARLKQGDRIGLLLGAANRDPAAFADPGRLDLARAPNNCYACRVRRRHPFLPRRAAGAARIACRARHAVRPAAGTEAGRGPRALATPTISTASKPSG